MRVAEMNGAEMRLWPVPVEEEVLDIPHRIRTAASRRPEHIALIDGPLEITAAALVDRMDRVAAALAALGLAEGDVIATVGGLTADHLALYLGAAALGVCVAPLPTSGHPEALARMRENAGAAQVFADAAAPETPGAHDLERFVAEAQHLAPLAPRRIGADTLFDIIYSSGTTGAPVVGQFEMSFLRGLYGPRFLGAGAAASTKATRSSISQGLDTSPAAIAGVMRSVLWVRQKL